MRHLSRYGSVFVLLVWIIMVGALVNREFLSPTGDLPLLDGVVSEIEEQREWMGIYAKDKKVGFARSQISKDGDGFLIEELVNLRMRLIGIPREVKSTITIRTDDHFVLRSFQMSLASGPTHYAMTGRVKGKKLVLDIQTAGRRRSDVIDLQEIPFLSQNLRYVLLRKAMDVGREYRLPLFDPLTARAYPLEIRVEAQESWSRDGLNIPVYRLLYTWQGLRGRAWVTQAGETLKEEGWGGFTLIRETPETAITKGWPDEGGIDLMRATSVPVKVQISSPRKLSYLRVRFSKADMTPFTFNDARQKTRGRLVEVTREDPSRAVGYVMGGSSDADWGDMLDSTPLIQSDDPQVRALADNLVNGAENALSAVERLLEWVYKHIEKVPTVSVPSAVEVLRTKQGDCNEHANLFAALTRAVGIPTKVCAGLLYQEGRFYYHAWNEVYLGAWFSVDALLGQFPADASHVKLVEGDLDSQAKLLPLIGTLKVEILNYR